MLASAPHLSAVMPPAASPGKSRILYAAIHAFARRGYHGASVRFIANNAQVDPALINHQYGSKERLWRLCVDEVAARVFARLAPMAAKPSTSFREAVEELADLVCDEPVIVKFILAEISREDERFNYVYEKLIEPITQALHRCRGSEARRHAPSEQIQILAIAGAIATTVASRSVLTRLAPEAADETVFREELKQAVALFSSESKKMSSIDGSLNDGA